MTAGRWAFDDVRSDDVYLVSYPRSGSTWLRCLLTSAVGGRPADPAAVAATVPDIHRSDPARRPSPDPLLVKSHTARRALPARVVHLVRDGRAVMPSFLRHQQRRGRVGADVDVATFALGDPWPCRWHDHVLGWLDAADARPPGSTLLVRYEDLVARTAATLRIVVAFAGLACDEASIAQAVAWNTLDRLKRVEAAAGAGTLEDVGTSGAGWSEDGLRRFTEASAATLDLLGYRQAEGAAP